jgi:glycosyltransferase involved in cell wall biosynthesis
MKVLGFCSYPVEAAATRFRMAQFVEPLAARGIKLDIHPFLSSEQFSEFYKGSGLAAKSVGMVRPLIGRLNELLQLRKYDLIFIQREAMIFGPGVFEWLCQTIGGIPMVLDLDDATYVRYVSPSYGRIGSALKFFGKTDNLIKRAALVVCGNRFIAEHVESKGTKAVVIPTVVDTNLFCPVERENEIPLMGWIGTHSTFPFLESLFPVLKRLAKDHRFRLKIVGSGRDSVKIDGVEVDNRAWRLDREIADFQSLDIGLYPIIVSDSANEQWIAGKSGFKAIQYMSVGVPFVMSPVGICAEIGKPDITHFVAKSSDEWSDQLRKLLELPDLRANMGMESRKFALENYAVNAQADSLATLFKEVTLTERGSDAK